jgi:hypothetical protein
LEAVVRSLSDQVAKLSAALEEERRRGKRQAAPFSKGPPVEEPKPPGRKSGILCRHLLDAALVNERLQLFSYFRTVLRMGDLSIRPISMGRVGWA